MTTLEERIAQFENMTSADPDNEMAHFSLGSGYLQAGRAAEAARSFQRCLELNGEMSKAYELAGQAMIEAGWEDQAAQTLRDGYKMAASKGDAMPRDAIAQLLQRLGLEPPKLSTDEQAAAESVASGDTFVCKRTGRAGMKLPDPPMRGAVGQWIFQNITAETWHDWMGQGTKVINELRLDLSREEDQLTFDQHMFEFLGIDDKVLGSLSPS